AGVSGSGDWIRASVPKVSAIEVSSPESSCSALEGLVRTIGSEVEATSWGCTPGTTRGTAGAMLRFSGGRKLECTDSRDCSTRSPDDSLPHHRTLSEASPRLRSPSETLSRGRVGLYALVPDASDPHWRRKSLTGTTSQRPDPDGSTASD